MGLSGFQDHMNGGSSTTTVQGGGQNRNKKKKNQHNGGGGGSGGGPGRPLGLGNRDISPDLDFLDKGIGLNAPATGGFALGAGTPLAGGASSTTAGGGFNHGGIPLGGGRYSDKEEYEAAQFRNKPREAYGAMLGTAGLTVGGTDTFGQWLANEYDRPGGLYDQFNTLRTDKANENLSWFDYLGQLGGVQYGQPGWAQGMNQYMQHLYNSAGRDQRGVNYTPYEGTSRWLAYG